MSGVLDGPAGFALRKNGTCLDTEVDCGATLHPFRACCPAGSHCPSQYNVDCCPSAANCTQLLVETPKCANETWDLYNYYGYFCCENGTTAFGTSSNSDGCALPGYKFDSSETLLPVVSKGKGTWAVKHPESFRSMLTYRSSIGCDIDFLCNIRSDELYIRDITNTDVDSVLRSALQDKHRSHCRRCSRRRGWSSPHRFLGVVASQSPNETSTSRPRATGSPRHRLQE